MASSQKAIFLPAERFAQFAEYADRHGLRPVECFKQLFTEAMERDGLYIPFPSFNVAGGSYRGSPCVSIGTRPRVRLTPTEAHDLAEALLHATVDQPLPDPFTSTTGGTKISVSRRGSSVKLHLGETEHTLSPDIATDLARHLQAQTNMAMETTYGN